MAKEESHMSSTLLNLRLSACAAGLALAVSALPSFAAGEFLDIELPSMRSPVGITASAAASSLTLPMAPTAPLTRADVQEALRTARLAGLVTPSTEAGDTPEILASREVFYALQTEVLLAEYADQQRQAMVVKGTARPGKRDVVEVNVEPGMTASEVSDLMAETRPGRRGVVLIIHQDKEADD